VSVAATKLELPEPTPEELARLAQAGEVSAFEAVVSLYGPRLLRYVRQRVGNLHTAEDLVQDTFLKAFAALDAYDSSRSLTTWLFTIATRIAISHGRRRFEISMAAPDELGRAETNAPDERMRREEEHHGVWDHARSVLPESQFATIWLKYAEDMPVNQIAEIMDVSVSNVKVLLHRARKRLADCITIDDSRRGPKKPAEVKRSNTGSDEVNYVRRPEQSGRV
jgi:RNA polymerase sigma-70 factor (ECF subfamily)